jgi:hypothetical protein
MSLALLQTLEVKILLNPLAIAIWKIMQPTSIARIHRKLRLGQSVELIPNLKINATDQIPQPP